MHSSAVSRSFWILVLVAAGVANCNATSRLSPIAQHRALTKPSLSPGRATAENSAGLSRGGGSVINSKQNQPSSPGAGISSSTFNLAKSIIGMGVLSLPSGLAYATDDRSAVIPASVLCIIYGAMAAHSFSTIGRVCDTYKVDSFAEAYRMTVSNSTAKIIPAFTTITCFLNALACSSMIGDSFSDIFQKLQAPAVLATRNGALVFLSAVVLLPLSLLNSLSALAPLSALGLFGTLFTAIMIGVRYFDGSYGYSNIDSLESTGLGRFLSDIPISNHPSFNLWRRNTGDWGALLSSASFILLSMFNTAYVAHYHAPRIYAELETKNMNTFNLITGLSFGLSSIVFVAMMSLGFLTFGGNSKGFILNNYASTDSFAAASRLAVGLTLLSGYPILFTALKDGIIDVFNAKEKSKNFPKSTKLVTALLLSIVTSLAMKFKDVSFLVSFAGALCGSMIMFVFPSLMSIRMEDKQFYDVRDELLDLEYSLPYWEKMNPDMNTLLDMDRLNNKMFKIRFKRALSYLMLIFGSVMSVAGVLVCVLREAGVELGA